MTQDLDVVREAVAKHLAAGDLAEAESVLE